MNILIWKGLSLYVGTYLYKNTKKFSYRNAHSLECFPNKSNWISSATMQSNNGQIGTEHECGALPLR